MLSELLTAAALVWIPPENFTKWNDFEQALKSKSSVKLTMALSPAMITPEVKNVLTPLINSGRIEIAARIHGDPILPFVAANPLAPRPDDALQRMAQARQFVEQRLQIPHVGFVPGQGALVSSLISPLGAGGAPWILVGPYTHGGDYWSAQNQSVFVPAQSVKLDNLSASGINIFDESNLKDSHFIDLLSQSKKPSNGWTTISELVKASGDNHAAATEVTSWPSFDGTIYNSPTTAEAKNNWQAYGIAAQTLERYQNSGAVDMRVLDSATSLLYRAQEARFFQPMAIGDESDENEFNLRLRAMYKKIKSAAPDSLYIKSAKPKFSNSKSSAVDQPTGLKTLSGNDWISFENPMGSRSLSPQGIGNSDAWKLLSIRIDWDEEFVTFHILPARVDGSPFKPYPLYDVYVDLNHMAGAGAVRLLEGRNAFAQSRDAWEFALCINANGKAHLYRASGPAGEAEEISALKVEIDTDKIELRVKVPRNHLRGNPLKWGYIALALAEDPSKPNMTPPSSLVNSKGNRILGLLGNLEVQKGILDQPNTPQRIPAARLENLGAP